MPSNEHDAGQSSLDLVLDLSKRSSLFFNAAEAYVLTTREWYVCARHSLVSMHLSSLDQDLVKHGQMLYKAHNRIQINYILL